MAGKLPDVPITLPRDPRANRSTGLAAKLFQKLLGHSLDIGVGQLRRTDIRVSKDAADLVQPLQQKLQPGALQQRLPAITDSRPATGHPGIGEPVDHHIPVLRQTLAKAGLNHRELFDEGRDIAMFDIKIGKGQRPPLEARDRQCWHIRQFAKQGKPAVRNAVVDLDAKGQLRFKVSIEGRAAYVCASKDIVNCCLCVWLDRKHLGRCGDNLCAIALALLFLLKASTRRTAAPADGGNC